LHCLETVDFLNYPDIINCCSLLARRS